MSIHRGIFYFPGNWVHSFKSIDLGSAAQAKPGYLRGKLSSYIEDLADYSERRWASVTVCIEDDTQRELRIAIPQGPHPASQKAIMKQMKVRALKCGVTLNFVRFP
ncbi:MAG TPA: hypothetical protein VNT30_24120 [Stellaceae bacterium]|nr:hypothetical protein [Stellaceae bacterium]